MSADQVGHCDACDSVVLWVDVDGQAVPLNLRRERFVAVGMVALNPVTGGARPVADDNVDAVLRWSEKGLVELHVLHTVTCPARAR